MSPSSGNAAWLGQMRPVGYFLAVQLILVPIVDFLTNVWPPKFDELAWRYGSVGLFSGYLLTPLLGLFLLSAISLGAGDRRALRVTGWLGVVTGAATLLGLPLFGLDVIQLRGTVSPEGRSAFDVGAARAAAKHLLGAIALLWLGIVALRAQRQMPVAPGGTPGLVRRPSGPGAAGPGR